MCLNNFLYFCSQKTCPEDSAGTFFIFLFPHILNSLPLTTSKVFVKSTWGLETLLVVCLAPESPPREDVLRKRAGMGQHREDMMGGGAVLL